MQTHDDNRSFAEMFADAATAKDTLKPGQRVEATVVRVGKDWIFLDLGAKSEGLVARNECLDADGQPSVKEGDLLAVYFLSEKNNERLFTTKIGGAAAHRHLEEAYQAGVPVEGMVVAETKGGFEVKISGSIRAFCPFSQIDLRRADDAAAYIGKKFAFRISRYAENGRNIVLSRRDLLEEERERQKEALRHSLAVGQTVNGVITSIRDFGAFVDIGGLEGLIPVSEIAWGRIDDINERLSPGQEVSAVVRKLDWDNERYSFSLKDTLPDPWQELAGVFAEGSTHTGTVARLTDFGAFVTLAPGIDGLVHISKLGAGRRINHPREVAQVGESIEVTIEGVDPEKKRISLALPRTGKGAEDSAETIKTKKGAEPEPNRDDFRSYMAAKKKEERPMATFADLFKGMK